MRQCQLVPLVEAVASSAAPVSMPGGVQLARNRPQAGCPPPRMPPHRPRSRACRSAWRAMAALSGAPPSEPASGLLRRMVAELHSAAPGDAQPLLRPLRSSLALRLRHQCHDPDGQVVCLRQVDRGELHAAVAQRQQEGGVLREPIELGDDQCRAGDPGAVSSRGHAGTGICPLSTCRPGGCATRYSGIATASSGTGIRLHVCRQLVRLRLSRRRQRRLRPAHRGLAGVADRRGELRSGRSSRRPGRYDGFGVELSAAVSANSQQIGRGLADVLRGVLRDRYPTSRMSPAGPASSKSPSSATPTPGASWAGGCRGPPRRASFWAVHPDDPAATTVSASNSRPPFRPIVSKSVAAWLMCSAVSEAVLACAPRYGTLFARCAPRSP